MTDLLTRPTRTSTDGAAATTPDETSLWLRGILAALWAVAVGAATLVVLVLIVWATDSRSGAGAGDAVRVALQLWLVGHKVPLHIGAGTVALAPLGLTLALGFVVARAAAVLARGRGIERPVEVAQVAVAVGLPYAVLTAFVAAAATGGHVHPSPAAALAAGLVVGCLAAAWGAARGSGQVVATALTIPERYRSVVAAAGLAVGLLAAVSVLLVLGSLAAHARTAADLADSLGGGAVAAMALVVLDAMLLPNAALAAVGYLSGPGFAVGAGSSISLGGAHTATLPSLPLLAAVPHTAAPALVRVLAVVVLLAAGCLAGWWVTRDGVTSVVAASGRGLAAGGITGTLLCLLVGIAGGPAGAGRMATVGASPWQVGLVVGGEIALVAALVAAPVAWARNRAASDSSGGA